MPSKNCIKSYTPNSYYHVYNRGVNREGIFKNEEDYKVFLNLFKRHLSSAGQADRFGRQYDYFGDKLELLAYCLMPNHFHMLIYQSNDPRAIELFMRKIITAYAMYFNKKYKRVGPLFQGRYKAVGIIDDSYLLHISRYIHLNPVGDYDKYEWSSYPSYIGKVSYLWLKTGKIKELFGSKEEYSKFVSDYNDYKDSIEQIKELLFED
jgi:putative transposase